MCGVAVGGIGPTATHLAVIVTIIMKTEKHGAIDG
jgi:hypothetical protein